ncbi:MAG: AAA family ATPase [Microcoleus sp. CAN_BIN18]|nr:AAA family ATPase [Microcoleus sp. CAN_BIN18]
MLATLDDQRTAINDYLHPLVNESKLNPTYLLSQCVEETGFTETQLAQWIRTINRKGQAIIQGPPGTGKTFLAQKLAKHLIGDGDGFSGIIQFHSAYTYEDFIQGLRPQSQDGQLTYPVVPGRFLGFCRKAVTCKDTSVLIIDEINRANLSQVFGELMYLLDDREDTKRFITLASSQNFRIPTNVRIIGTMNTADRSIALVDQALRRRFAFISLFPNYELLQNYHDREQTGFPVNKLIGILKNINLAINNKHYELGISFFLTKTLSEDIQDIWQMEIEPYLEEYFFDDQAKMDEFLWDKIKDKLSN